MAASCPTRSVALPCCRCCSRIGVALSCWALAPALPRPVVTARTATRVSHRSRQMMNDLVRGYLDRVMNKQHWVLDGACWRGCSLPRFGSHGRRRLYSRPRTCHALSFVCTAPYSSSHSLCAAPARSPVLFLLLPAV